VKVKEIMTKKITSLNFEDNAVTALELLLKLKISGLPVINDTGKLVGMFTEKEILAKILPKYLENVGGFVYDENPKAVKQKILSFGDLKVKDVMRKEVITIDEDSALCEVAHTMLVQKARRIPIIDKAKNIVGIVSRGDIVKALFNEYK